MGEGLKSVGYWVSKMAKVKGREMWEGKGEFPGKKNRSLDVTIPS